MAVSEAGRNPKQPPVIFALAACCASADADVRRLALEALSRVCRTGTHLFLFAGFVEQFRGWGRGLRRAIGRWYTDRDADALAFQLIKYARREGWSHRDLLRLAKPTPERGSPTDLALRWAVGKLEDSPAEATPRLIMARRRAQDAATSTESARLIEAEGLPWEAINSEHLTSPEVWKARRPWPP
ncbi:MAG: TROVE domain-containing protein [Acidimicrobiales bacterium]